MPSNFTPIDLKKWDKKGQNPTIADAQKSSNLLNILLGSIILVTVVILGVLLFQLYQRNLLNTLL